MFRRVSAMGVGLQCEELHMVTHGRLLLGVTHVLQGRNQIGDRGAEMIGEGLKVNRSLRELHLVRLVFVGLCFELLFGC